MCFFPRDKINLMGEYKHFSMRVIAVRAGLLLACLLSFLAGCLSQNNPPEITPVLTLEKSPGALSAELKATIIAIHATPTPLPSPTPWKLASPTPDFDLTPSPLLSVNPFTGLRVSNYDRLLRKPLLVKLLNWPRSQRPFSGINQADLVFEFYTGHQTNQLLALFYTSDGESIGPLGPGRLVDARLTRHYQADLVVSTVDTMIKGVFDNTLPERVFYQGYTPCPGICTQPVAQGGKTFADTYAIREIGVAERPRYQPPRFEMLTFSDSITKWDEDATRFSFLYADFSVMDWRFNPDTGKYHLWQEVEDQHGTLQLAPSLDTDGEPVAFENVVFALANYIEYNSSTYDINLREGDPDQQAILLRDGKMTYGTWFAATDVEPFSFFADGRPYALKPGRSWITFSTTISRPERINTSEWDLLFRLR